MIHYQTAVLDNGLRIIALQTASPVVYCGYQINAGAAHEQSNEEGIAHFCEHVTFKGTTHRTALDVINCLEEVGGDLNAFTTKTDTVYYSAILKEHLSRAISLLTDIVFHSVYPQKEIDKEVEVICDEIESYNDSPSELIYDEFEKPLPVLSAYEPQTIKIDKHTHQAHVMIGNRAYAVHDKRRMALYLLNNILGGPGMNARLNLALRERRGLVYTVESTMVSYSSTGLWSIYFGCDAQDVDECIALVRAELDHFIDKPLTDSELTIAKQQIKGQIGIACDNRENLALDFGKGFLHYGWKKDITALYRYIVAITAEEIQAVAQELFVEEQLTKLIYE